MFSNYIQYVLPVQCLVSNANVYNVNREKNWGKLYTKELTVVTFGMN